MTHCIYRVVIGLITLCVLTGCSTKFDTISLDNEEIKALGQTVTVATVKDQFTLFPIGKSRNVNDDPENVALVEANIISRLESYGYTVSTQNVAFKNRSYDVPDMIMNNIWVKKSGTDPKNPIVIGAHWDTTMDTPGMVDNASGCVGLIEILRLLKDTPVRDDIYFVFFALEEEYDSRDYRTFAGSQAFYDYLNSQDITPKLAYNLDMIGYVSETQPSPSDFGFLLDYPTKGNRLMVFSLKKNILPMINVTKISKKWVPDLPLFSHAIVKELVVTELFHGWEGSDHFTFWKKDIDTLFFTNGDKRFIDHIHTSSDTYDKLDFTFTQRAIQLIFYSVYMEANQ